MKRFRKRKLKFRKRKRIRGLSRTGGFYQAINRRRLNSPEVKWLDFQPTATYQVNNAGSVDGSYLILNKMLQGVNNNQRIGNKITMKSILSRITVTYQQTDLRNLLNVNDTFRVIIGYDKQTNGADVALSEVLALAGAGGTIDSPLNLFNKDRFIIFVDKTYNFPSSGLIYTTQSPIQQKMTIKIYKKLNHTTQYGSSTADVGAIKTGGLFFFIFNDLPSTTTTIFQQAYHRLRFIDP